MYSRSHSRSQCCVFARCISNITNYIPYMSINSVGRYNTQSHSQAHSHSRSRAHSRSHSHSHSRSQSGQLKIDMRHSWRKMVRERLPLPLPLLLPLFFCPSTFQTFTIFLMHVYLYVWASKPTCNVVIV